MNDLIVKLRKIADENPLVNFEWAVPANSPVEIPENIISGYEKNIYLKENFHSILGSDGELIHHYWTIQEWGGIGSFKRNEKNNNRIRKFFKELKAEKLTRDSFGCISSLSKVASFVFPDKYAIYDSRAIYSLNWLLFNSNNDHALFPQPIGRSAELAKYDMQTIFRLTNRQFEFESYKNAYHKYCMLMKELSSEVFGSSSKPYHLEMLLFMIAPTWVIKNIKDSVVLHINNNA